MATSSQGGGGGGASTIENHYIEFSEEERQLYELIEANSRELLVERNSFPSPRFLSVFSYLVGQLLMMSLEMALCKKDYNSYPFFIKDGFEKPELLPKLVANLQDEHFECPICLNRPTNVVIVTSCGHMFCHRCLLKHPNFTKTFTCPICRCILSKLELCKGLVQRIKVGNTKPFSPEINMLSSKIDELIKLLVALRNEGPTTKAIVFTLHQTISFIIESGLELEDIKTKRIDDEMQIEEIEEFNMTDECFVLLTSIVVPDLNPAAASVIYLLSPSLLYGHEVINMVHQIGQEKEVKIMRLLVKNTIEENLWKLLDEKEQVATNGIINSDVIDSLVRL